MVTNSPPPQDPENVPAWVARGEAFLAMGTPLLANLHFDRAVRLDPKCSAPHAPKKITSRKAASVGLPSKSSEAPASTVVSAALMVENDAEDMRYAAEEENRDIPGCITGTVTASDISRYLASACKDYREGIVLHQEAFLASSEDRFRRVLSWLDAAEIATRMICTEKSRSSNEKMFGEMLTPGETSEVTNCKPAPGKSQQEEERMSLLVEAFTGTGSRGELVRNMRVVCHLNIAAAALLRQKDYGSAVQHCTR